MVPGAGATPLHALFRKHSLMGESDDDAVNDAGRDLSSLTNTVLYEDKRTFVRGKSSLVRSDSWTGGEP